LRRAEDNYGQTFAARLERDLFALEFCDLMRRAGLARRLFVKSNVELYTHGRNAREMHDAADSGGARSPEHCLERSDIRRPQCRQGVFARRRYFSTAGQVKNSLDALERRRKRRCIQLLDC
jgi:hypothetical protein